TREQPQAEDDAKRPRVRSELEDEGVGLAAGARDVAFGGHGRTRGEVRPPGRRDVGAAARRAGGGGGGPRRRGRAAGRAGEGPLPSPPAPTQALSDPDVRALRSR